MIRLNDLELIKEIKENIVSFEGELQGYLKNSFSEIEITSSPTLEDAEKAIRNFPEVFTIGKKVGPEFLDLVKQLQKYEELLITVDDSYRDHFLHQVRVALLGLYIMKKGNIIDLIKSSNRYLFDKIGNDENCEFAWLYASLFHDIGYPIAKLNNINDYVINMVKLFPFIRFEKKPEIQQYEYDFDYKDNLEKIANFNNKNNFLLKALTNYCKKDHGIISSLIVYNKFTNEKREQFLLPGLQGMAMHNLSKEKLGFEIKFEEYPFAYLLVLCDEIQEWGRQTRAGLISDRIVPFKYIDFELNFNDCDNSGVSIEIYLKCNREEMQRFNRLVRGDGGGNLDLDERFQKKFVSLQRLTVCNKINIKFVLENISRRTSIFTEDGKWKKSCEKISDLRNQCVQPK